MGLRGCRCGGSRGQCSRGTVKLDPIQFNSILFPSGFILSLQTSIFCVATGLHTLKSLLSCNFKTLFTRLYLPRKLHSVFPPKQQTPTHPYLHAPITSQPRPNSQENTVGVAPLTSPLPLRFLLHDHIHQPFTLRQERRTVSRKPRPQVYCIPEVHPPIPG